MTSQKLRLDAFLPYKLSVASNLASDVIADSYQKLFGLKVPEWRLLAVIAESDGITQQEIGVRTRMDKVTVSRAAIALVERKLVSRMPNRDDGRSHLLTLSPSGSKLYASVVPEALALEARIFSDLDAQELAVFTGTVTKIESAALKILQDRATGELD